MRVTPASADGEAAARDDEAARVAALERQLAEQARQFAALAEQARAQAERTAALEQERAAAGRRLGEAKRHYEQAQAELAAAEPRRAAAERMRLQVEAELAQLRAQHQMIVSSTMWRAAQPLRRIGASLPPGLRRALRSGARLGWWTVTLRLGTRLRQRKAMLLAQPPVAAVDAPAAPPTTVQTSVDRRFPALEALRTYPDLRSGRRLSIVTDSINAGSLYGGVGTSMIFAALLARRLGADLRLITRAHEAEPGRVGAFLDSFGLAWQGDVATVFSPGGAGADVPVSGDDLFLTTSWWSTHATRQSVDPRRIVYLLQEDERMFYPHGDERLRCIETLASDDIRFVVNSEMLFRHLTEGDAALANIARHASWFEPAFPLATYHDDEPARQRRGVKNFMFYARPNNLRNLYWRGLEAIGAAIQDGTLRPEKWNFTFVGRDLSPVLLPFGVRPKLIENLPWAEYAALIRHTDLGLSLIDTPHPSYPPLDLAASGAVAVTNQCGRKTSLTRYSENILCVPATVAGVRQGLADGARLVSDPQARAANFARNGIMRDWAETLEASVQGCAEWLG